MCQTENLEMQARYLLNPQTLGSSKGRISEFESEDGCSNQPPRTNGVVALYGKRFACEAD